MLMTELKADDFELLGVSLCCFTEFFASKYVVRLSGWNSLTRAGCYVRLCITSSSSSKSRSSSYLTGLGHSVPEAAILFWNFCWREAAKLLRIFLSVMRSLFGLSDLVKVSLLMSAYPLRRPD